MKFSSYDVIVIGAGPAGSAAAAPPAAAGLRALLLEKRERIGVPVRCGEATGNRRELARFLPVDEAWIQSDLHTFVFAGPAGREIRKSLPDLGVLLDRAKFDQAMADRAAAQGTEVVTGAQALGLLGGREEPFGVRVLYRGKAVELPCRLVIGADGTEGMVSRWAGLPLDQANRGVYSALEYELDCVAREPGTLKIVFGREHIPNGYYWIFPKDKKGTVKVGAGWLSHSFRPEYTLQNHLDEFLAKCCLSGKIINTVGGTIPLDGPRKELAANRVLLAGDAAHLANPLSAGGIMNALESGRLAGEWAVRAFRKNRFDAGFLHGYVKDVHRQIGRLGAVHRRLRGMVLSLSDGNLARLMDAAAPIAEHVTREKLTQPSYYMKGSLKFIRLFPALAPLLKGMIFPKEE